MKKTRKGQISNIIFTMIVTAFVTIIVTCLVLYSNGYINKSATKSNSSYNKLNSKLDLIKSEINQTYVGNDVDENKMEEYAVKGYVAGLGDIYSTYYTPDEMKELLEETEGEYYGIGVYMTIDKENNLIKI